jgi:hypothetical protein
MKNRSLTRWLWACLLLLPLSALSQVTLVSTGAVWKYLDNGSDQGIAWKASAFDDSSWASGPAQLGYGDGDEATVVSFGLDANNKYITTYFRRAFNVPNASSITNLRARLQRDDGAVVYLNGVEVFRNNMPGGSVLFNTLASAAAPDDGGSFFPTALSPSSLVTGNNVVAVEIHQNAANSSDISFDFELVGNPVPTIAISSPTNNQVLSASSVTISGTAIPSGTNLPLVEAFAGGTKVGESASANFSIVWPNVAPNSYVLQAKITDGSGLVATSAPVNITVQSPPASILVPRHSTWKYQNLNQDLSATSWKELSYDDSSWGGPLPGPLGDNNEGGTQLCTSVIDIGPTGTRYPVVYYRRAFTVSGAANYQSLILRLNRDDSAVIYLNGTLIKNDGVPEPITFSYSGGTAAAGADEVTYFEYVVPSTALQEGPNVLAVENHQQANTSSDLQFDLEVEGAIDTTPPDIVSIDPQPDTTVLDLTFINVVFTESVFGVNASDLLVGGETPTSVVTNSPADYTFYFTKPPTGIVHVAWVSSHGITDTTPLANPFGGGSWSYTLDPTANKPNVRISEFMADNNRGIQDDDGTRSDWIELLNAGTLPVNLNGWFLTDNASNLTKWTFPPVVIDPNKYLLVWASSKNRTNPAAPLHTNFKLGKDGGYLGLADPNTNVVSAFNPYPAQQTDVSYGSDRVDPTLVGFYSVPTPGAQNSTSGTGFAPEPVFSLASGIYTNASLTLTITAPSGTIRYTVDGSLPTATNSILYSGPITFGTNLTIKARVFPADTTIFPSAIVARNFIFLDDSTIDFNSNLPVLIISTEGRAIPQNIPPGRPRTKGSLVAFDAPNGHSSLRAVPDFQGSADFEIFGQTSAGFAKQPIRFELQDTTGSDLKVSLLGRPADSDFKLRNPYDDKTLMNDFLGAELHGQMGHYNLNPQFVEVFVDVDGRRLTYASNYYGVLVLFDTIKVGKNRVDIDEITPYATNEPAITGGWIFKKDKDSTGDLNFSTTGGGGLSAQALKLHEPKPNQLRTVPVTGPLTPAGNIQINWLRNYLNQMEKVLYAPNWLTAVGTNHYSYYLDVDSFVDFHWLVEFTKQIDGYRLSDYFTKARNGKVQMEPMWDWNLSFGNANYLDGGHTNRWYYEDLGDADHIWLRRLIAGSALATGTNGDPDFTQKIADRWSVLRTNVLNGPNVVARIDQISTMLSNAANRDFAYFKTLGIYLWPNPDGAMGGGTTRNWDVDYQNPTRYMGTPTSIVGYMKKFVLGRFLWIDSQFLAPPLITASDGQVTNGFVVSIVRPPNSTLFYTLDGSDPRGPGGTTNGIPYTGAITINGNVRIVARARGTGTNVWKNTWSGPAAVSLYTATPQLRITEIMFHPAAPPPGGTNFNDEDFEFVEVKNIGATPLNVNRFSLGGGISFQFPNVVLTAGQSAVIVKNVAAFQSRYGTAITILGTFSGNLNNAGDHLVLSGGSHEPILDFSFEDKWYPAADGLGFSLVSVNDNAPTSNWGLPGNWRASTGIGGSPGQNDPLAPARPGVVINEALTHTDPPASDAIELYNPTANPVNVGGWFLSDDFNTPKKFIIGPGTTIPARGYLVFYETNSFNFPTNAPTSFALSSHGDQVWLFSGDGINLTGYAHGFDFGAAANGVSFGRYVISTGEDHFVAQRTNSLNATNAGPLVGPIVITEINYHPADVGVIGQAYANTLDEFIELRNIAATNTPLYNPAAPTNTWHLRDAVDYTFPTNVSLAPGAFLLVVSFDPVADPATAADFRARNSVPGGVPLYGPWDGHLDNHQASVELNRPDVPEIDGSTTYLLVERVKYSDAAPWQNGSDGFGMSLQRIVQSGYGNDPSNWVALAISPGSLSTPSGTPPNITSQSASRRVPIGTDLQLSVTATGTQPLRYQWQLNGLNLTGATNATLTVTNFQATQAGDYNAVVYNSAGSVRANEISIVSGTALRITTQPANRAIQPGQTTNITIVAIGSGSLRYRWLLNNADITASNVLGTDSDTITITNAQPSNEGLYTCVVFDDFDSLTSDPATLSVSARAAFVVHPVSQTAVEGGSATLTVVVAGSTPMSYRWRKGTTTLSTGAIFFTNRNSIYSFITLTNIQMSDAANYNVVVSNLVGFATGGPQNGVSSNATLTVLADFDRDGLPDVWEAGRPGFSTNNAADALRDDDHDGMSNVAEYIAGTDYLDPTSYLKVNIVRAGLANISFIAVSNRTYTVLYSDGLNPPQWQKLSDVVARTSSRTEVVADLFNNTNRYYRLVIPIQR